LIRTTLELHVAVPAGGRDAVAANLVLIYVVMEWLRVIRARKNGANDESFAPPN